jgi:hypothetical protein
MVPEHPEMEESSPQKLSADEAHREIWDYRLHEDDLFANRLSFYMLAQSFLVVSEVTAITSAGATDTKRSLGYLIATVGLVLTGFFAFIFIHHVRLLQLILQKLRDDTRARNEDLHDIWTEYFRERHESLGSRLVFRRPPSQLMAYGISLLFALMWVALLVLVH